MHRTTNTVNTFCPAMVVGVFLVHSVCYAKGRGSGGAAPTEQEIDLLSVVEGLPLYNNSVGI